MTHPLPIITSLTYHDKRLAKRFRRAVRSSRDALATQRDLPYSSETCFEWKLPHGHRQAGRVRGLRIVMSRKHAAQDGGLLLRTVSEALENRQDTDLERISKERLSDFYIAAAASTAATGQSLKITPPTPFAPAHIAIIDLASHRRPENVIINPDLPIPAFAWFKISLTDDPSVPWIVGTVASEYKLVDFDEIDAIDAMAATSNLAQPYPFPSGE